MKKKTKKIILGSVLACILFGIAGAAHIYYYFFAQPFQITDTTYIYIDRDDDVDSVYHKIIVQVIRSHASASDSQLR